MSKKHTNSKPAQNKAPTTPPKATTWRDPASKRQREADSAAAVEDCSDTQKIAVRHWIYILVCAFRASHTAAICRRLTAGDSLAANVDVLCEMDGVEGPAIERGVVALTGRTPAELVDAINEVARDPKDAFDEEYLDTIVEEAHRALSKARKAKTCPHCHLCERHASGAPSRHICINGTCAPCEACLARRWASVMAKRNRAVEALRTIALDGSEAALALDVLHLDLLDEDDDAEMWSNMVLEAIEHLQKLGDASLANAAVALCVHGGLSRVDGFNRDYLRIAEVAALLSGMLVDLPGALWRAELKGGAR